MLSRLFGAEPPLPVPQETVAVSLKTGATILGVLVRVENEFLLLRGAVHMGVDRNQQETRAPLDGEVVIPMENVDYWQDGLDPNLLLNIPEA